jgi:hypothetical protein
MSVDPNAPAYPCRPSEAHKGLTIRQAYAMAAMQGFSACEAFADYESPIIAPFAFAQADAMIAHENGEASQ